jgi:hypothetical protein
MMYSPQTNHDQPMRTTIDIHPTDAAVNAAAVRPCELALAGVGTPLRYDRALPGRRVR